MEEGATAPDQEVGCLTKAWDVEPLHGVDGIGRVHVHQAVAQRAAGEAPALDHTPEFRRRLHPMMNGDSTKRTSAQPLAADLRAERFSNKHQDVRRRSARLWNVGPSRRSYLRELS